MNNNNNNISINCSSLDNDKNRPESAGMVDHLQFMLGLAFAVLFYIAYIGKKLQ